MVHWNEKINIAHLHRLFTSGGLSLQNLSRGVVRKLQNTEVFATAEPELIDIMCAFDAIDELAQLDDYIAVLDMLYDFGDKDHMLWIDAEGAGSESDDVFISNRIRNPFDENNTEPYLNIKGPYPKIQDNTTTAKIEQWDSKKIYDVGENVYKNNFQYKCIISCSNVDPSTSSYSKPGDCWEWIRGSYLKTTFDPALVLTDRITCIVPDKARVYPPTRKYHYMSEEEFNTKLAAADINPANLTKEFYSYMKDCEEHYQKWLIERWHKNNLTLRMPTAA